MYLYLKKQIVMNYLMYSVFTLIQCRLINLIGIISLYTYIYFLFRYLFSLESIIRKFALTNTIIYAFDQKKICFGIE